MREGKTRGNLKQTNNQKPPPPPPPPFMRGKYRKMFELDVKLSIIEKTKGL